MKISRNKVILIALMALVLIAGIACKIFLNKEEKTETTKNKCDDKNFFIGSYSSEKLKDKENYYILKTKKDYEAKKDIIKFNDTEKLDFENYDYLVFFVPTQLGCNRTYQLKCFEQKENEIYLNFEKNEVDEYCDAIFFDSIIVELQKDKYNNETKIKTNI